MQVTRRGVLGSCIGALVGLFTGKLGASFRRRPSSESGIDEDIARLKRVYGPRIETMMGRLRKMLIEEGFLVDEVYDLSGDAFTWSFLVPFSIDGDEERPCEEDVDVVFTICESEEYDGEEGGVNFEIMVAAVGGQILTQFCLSNYTSEVWVDRRDHEAVEKRFYEFAEESFNELAQCLKESLWDWRDILSSPKA